MDVSEQQLRAIFAPVSLSKKVIQNMMTSRRIAALYDLNQITVQSHTSRKATFSEVNLKLREHPPTTRTPKWVPETMALAEALNVVINLELPPEGEFQRKSVIIFAPHMPDTFITQQLALLAATRLAEEQGRKREASALALGAAPKPTDM